MKNNYSVYQHVTPDGMYYFGATNDIKRRWEGNGAKYKTTALQPYIEKYGWENIQHIILFRDQSKENALWIEDFLIETAREDGVCINKKRSGNISKEEGYFQQYYEENKQQINQYYKKYQEQNKDKIRGYQREYREQNKDKIRGYQREYQQEYCQKNKDKKRNYDKQYYEEHRDKILEQKRQYRERKKLEKQLKEAVETTLF